MPADFISPRVCILICEIILTLPLGWEVLAQLSLSDGHSVVRSKKKPVHRRTNPSGSFPLAGVLVWLSMYRLKSRILFAHQMGALV